MFDKAELHMLTMALRHMIGTCRTTELDLRRDIAWNTSEFGVADRLETLREDLAYAVDNTASWQALFDKTMAAYNEGN